MVYSEKRTEQPNILFIMTDQQRFDCLGCNGNDVIKTPNIDRLSKQSANCTSFFIQAPVCVPSRQTFFTGRYPHCHKNRVNYTGMNDDVTLMQKHLQDEGYSTGFVGKLHYYPPTVRYALGTGFDLGLLHDAGPTDQYSDYVKWLENNNAVPRDKDYRRCKEDTENPYVTVIPDEYHETTWCGLKTREMLGKLASGDKPFFLFSSYWKPHSPFELPEPWADMYADSEIDLPERVDDSYMTALCKPLKTLAARDGEKHHKIAYDELVWKYRAYYGAVSQIDHEVGLTLKKLEELGLSDNTIVIFCSDHGDMMYNHGMIDKNVFFDDAMHVPFMLRYPDTIEPGDYNELLESTDVLSTIFELCGLKTPYDNQGRSFAPLICNEITRKYKKREYVFAENIIPEVITDGTRVFSYEKGRGIKNIRHPDAKMVRSRKWKYNYYVDYEELYDLENDPGEKKNIVGDPAYAKIVGELRKVLLDWMITADESDQIAPAWFQVKDNEGVWKQWSEAGELDFLKGTMGKFHRRDKSKNT